MFLENPTSLNEAKNEKIPAKSNNIKPIIRSMTWRYLIALGLVAVLSCMAFISLQAVISTQETSAATINYSGKRRYMSHRAALYAVLLATAKTEQERQFNRKQMLEAISMMEEAHNGLMHGNVDLGLPGGASPAISAIYFEQDHPLEPLVRSYIARVKNLAQMPTEELSQNHPEVRWITETATGLLLDRLDAVVAEYQTESEQKIERLQILESTVFGITLLTLAMEAIFIFRPMVLRVNHERNQLLQSEASTRAILNNSYDAIVVLNRDGKILSANQAALKMANKSFDNILLENFTIFKLSNNEFKHWKHFPLGITSVKRETDSAVIDIAFTETVIADEKVYIATMRESTEQLQRYARDLESRNHELDQFAYVASHDLKAPLRAIVNLSQWICEDSVGDLKPVVQDHITMMQARAKRLEALIDGLHSYATAARPEGEPVEVDTGRLVHEIIEEHRQGSLPQEQKNFTFTVDDNMPIVIADKVRLWQVFTNLIANAIKHHDKTDGAIAVHAKIIDDKYEFSICDDGPGIDPSYHNKIFTIFQTLAAKDVKESLGLGLALVQKIVRDVGGTVTVNSRVGAGSIFKFTWPCRQASIVSGGHHARTNA